ncbi:unnamed protein product [Penicillium salamii]|uniref:Uncharacterized protein n=1 Tax=Penicillium salamii TaxID=1612424 RepID=A0A9W4NEP2_9EURO|nr:unnamed protein product [Penicillium salamii]CAG7997901.1 unnamed protein product [Penicillium salamii]CAG8077945.1 unnamed protein product [Penicillium salamii]CAG8354429.1 unnamed protein product [Penicillium salamii]CAG8355740.1 unnamed protein product [Penicillium salamii]
MARNKCCRRQFEGSVSKACDVTLANSLDLEQIHEDHDAGFFIEKKVAVGIARRFVRDITDVLGISFTSLLSLIL